MNAWVVCTTIIKRSDGKILILQQAPGKFHADKWGTPGGVLEPGKTLVEQAVIEVKEETGLKVKIESLLGIYLYKEKEVLGGKRSLMTVVFAFKGEMVGGEIQIPQNEISAFRWVSPKELLNWDKDKLRPMIPQIVKDYAQGKTFPLEAISDTK